MGQRTSKAQEGAESKTAVDSSSSALVGTEAPTKKSSKPNPRNFGKGHVCPEESANFLSRITFWWLNDIFVVGRRRPLDDEDIWDLGSEWRAEFLHTLLDTEWKKEIERTDRANAALRHEEINVDGNHADNDTTTRKHKKKNTLQKPSLWRAMRKAWWHRLGLVGLVKFASDMSQVFSPFLVKYILRFVAESKAISAAGGVIPPLGIGFAYAITLFVLQVLASLLNNYFFQIATTQGMAMRGAISAAIYRKSLRLSPGARQDFNAGKVMTVVSTDNARIELFLQFIHIMWTAPVMLLSICILLIIQLGPSALAGIGILVFFGPIQGHIMGYLARIRKLVAPITDMRVKLTQEILNGIRLLKFFAWEEPFVAKIEDIRKQEIRQVYKRGIMQALTTALAFGIPVIAASASIVIYALTNPMDATEIFPALTWFNLLRFPLMFLPQIIVGLADFRVALERVSSLLLAPELDDQPDLVTDADYAVKVENATFVWETFSIKLPEYKKKKDGLGTVIKGLLSKKEKKSPGDEGNISGNSPDVVNAGETAARPEMAEVKSETTSHSTTQPITTTPSSAIITHPPKSELTYLRNINLTFPKGQLIAIVGPVGAGKSSLLNALIGEMKREEGRVSYSGTIGYCPQQAWIQNATLRDNITFGRPFDQERYLDVLINCALGKDLEQLPDGDMTHIGERGINLSGGQKQRVNLARIMYYDSDIVLLDDPLSAVDAHVGRYLFDNLICGALKGKTRILVTHQLHVLPKVDFVVCMKDGAIAECGTYDDLMGRRGEFQELMTSYGGVEDSESDNDQKAEIVVKEEGGLLQVQPTVDTVPVDAIDPLAANDQQKTTLAPMDFGSRAALTKIIARTKSARQLMSIEERAVGSVNAGVWVAYARAAGGLRFFISLIALVIVVQGSRVGSDLWLVYWTNDQISGFTQPMYVGVYWAWGVFLTITLYAFGLFFAYFGTRAARVLHEAALVRIVNAPMRFFDSTPLGRIISRFSKDTDMIDNTLADSFRMFTNTFANAVSTFILIIYATPLFVVPLVPVLFLYYVFQKIYRSASRELKRLDSTSRSPLYAHFGETLTGAATIRAYGEQDRFIAVNDMMVDRNNAPYFLLITAQRWLGTRLETLGSLLVFFASVFGLLNRTNDTLSTALLGLSLSYALQVTMALNWCVRQFTETEIAMNAVERVNHYAYEIETEPVPSLPPPPPSPSDNTPNKTQSDAKVDPNEMPKEDDDSVARDASSAALVKSNTSTIDIITKPKTTTPPPNWPSSGAITITNLTLQYAADLPAVLHNLAFTIRDREKVGIVGRTGSGKSTLIHALFRTIEPCTPTNIVIDGVRTADLELATLRRALAIIPQDPTLFSGTFRSNLDPFETCTDAEIWQALDRARLKEAVKAKGGLDASVAEGGENLSVGQRQLVCLARAVVKKPRILIMDEATANVDLETDSVIQQVLRDEFQDCTVLCVAHRLNTIIDYDRVLVLSAGHILEYDSPRNLLGLSSTPSDSTDGHRSVGAFKSMVEETGSLNAELLRSMVK
ncbi:hypothetical protein DFS34DRAFT_389500 [Phlyctochytrium arcticum]|nr:hypothetical protein DFS34DRAFT_389500 [Phlyctochytrium arcticum]